MRVPISSTNTKLRLSSLPTTERYASLSNSSLSLAPVDLFFGCGKGASWSLGRWLLVNFNSASRKEEAAPLFVGSPGRLLMSSSRRRMAFPSSFGREPGAFSSEQENRPRQAAQGTARPSNG